MYVTEASKLNSLLQDIDKTIKVFAPSLSEVAKNLLNRATSYLNPKGYYSLVAISKSQATNNFPNEQILSLKIDGRKRDAKVVIEFAEREISGFGKSFQAKVKFKWDEYKKINNFKDLPMYMAVANIFKLYFDRDILKKV